MSDPVSQNLRLYKVSQIKKIADAIRDKLQTSDTYTVDEMAQVIGDISSGSDLLKLMEHNSMSNRVTLTDDVLKSEATSIVDKMFYNRWITTISLSNIITVGSGAFQEANGSNGTRTQIILPNCKTIESYAFKDYSRSDAAIDALDLSNVETVGDYAFNRAKIWTKLVLPKCKSVGIDAFREAQFGGSGLEAPMLESISQLGFGNNYITPDVELPSIKTIGNYAFSHCTSVNFTIGPNCTSIGEEIFYAQNGVTNLYVQATTPPTLGGYFRSGYTGVQHIYVPAASVDLYKAANVWSGYASIIEAIPTA